MRVLDSCAGCKHPVTGLGELALFFCVRVGEWYDPVTGIDGVKDPVIGLG